MAGILSINLMDGLWHCYTHIILNIVNTFLWLGYIKHQRYPHSNGSENIGSWSNLNNTCFWTEFALIFEFSLFEEPHQKSGELHFHGETDAISAKWFVVSNKKPPAELFDVFEPGRSSEVCRFCPSIWERKEKNWGLSEASRCRGIEEVVHFEW